MEFGFRENPFLDVPDLRFTYRHRIFQDVCADLMFVRMSNRRGIALIEGPAGSGKTTLLATLDANRKPGESSVTLSAHRRLSVAKMIDICADALGFAVDSSLEPEELEGRLQAMTLHLAGMSDRGGVILLIDRAEMLSAAFLEALPRLLALGRDGGAVIHVVLAVTCEDDADPLPRAFNVVQDQIHFRSWLGSMSEEEVARYVSHRMIVAGDSTGKLYSDDGLVALNRFSGGVPGRINAISRQCIEFLTAEFMREADGPTVQRAADFLGLKPKARVGPQPMGRSPDGAPRAPSDAVAEAPAPRKGRSPFKGLRKRGAKSEEPAKPAAAAGEAQKRRPPNGQSKGSGTARPRERRPLEETSNVVGLPKRKDGGAPPPQMEARLIQPGGRGTRKPGAPGRVETAGGRAATARQTQAAQESRPARDQDLARGPRLDVLPRSGRQERPAPGPSDWAEIPPDAWDEPESAAARDAEQMEFTRQDGRQERPDGRSPKDKIKEIQKRRPYLLSRLGVVAVLIVLGVLLLGVYGRPERSVEPIVAETPPPETYAVTPEDARLDSLESRVADLANRLNEVQVERDNLVATLSALQLADQEAKLSPENDNSALSAGGNDLVFDLQRQLVSLGLDPGQSDGRLGRKTLNAIARYQEQQGLQVDRRASRALLDHMEALSLLKKAVVLYHEKDYAGAEAAYDAVVRLQPGDPDARFFRGLARLKLGEVDAAIEDMNWRGEADPRIPIAAFPPARVYFIQERLKDLEFDPGRGDGLYDAGTKNAINAYQRIQGLAMDADPSQDLLRHLEVYNHHAQAIAAYHRDDTDRALELYDMVLRLDGADAEAYFNRGLAHRKLGDVEQALADYTLAIQEDPSLAKAFYERGNLEFQEGRYGDAIGDYFSAARAWVFEG